MGEFDGQRVTVMGLGRFGGGVGAARWLAERGADVLATDMADEGTLGEALEPLRSHVESGAVTLRLGEHNVSDFTDTDLVVVNPGVPRPWGNRFVRAAQAAGVRCTTEIGLLTERLPDRRRVIGITGTAGKSTTTGMVAAGLRGAGSVVHVGGNIGGSLLGTLDGIGSDDFVVLELSSAMLWWLGGEDAPSAARRGGWSARVAVVTNLAPNHVDWHGSDAHYEQSKRAILAHQQPGDVAVLGGSVADWAVKADVRTVVVESGEFEGDLLMPGAHNRTNAALALAACEAAIGESHREAIVRGIGSYAGLPHRCQFVREACGVRMYNDSKCTVPGGVALAVDGVGEVVGGTERVHLIAGGSDKGVDLSEIGALAGRVAGLYAIGATAGAILETVAPEHAARSHRCGDLPGALGLIRERVRDGEAVLLSPGCASFGEFRNYEHRGDEFVRLVRELFPDGVTA